MHRVRSWFFLVGTEQKNEITHTLMGENMLHDENVFMDESFALFILLHRRERPLSLNVALIGPQYFLAIRLARS